LSQLKHQNDERIHDRILLPLDMNSGERFPKLRDTSIRQISPSASPRRPKPLV
jgi:hypothetical protein